MFKYIFFINNVKYSNNFLKIKEQNSLNSYYIKLDNKLYYIFCFNNFYNLLNFYKYISNNYFFIGYYILYNNFYKYNLLNFLDIISKFEVNLKKNKNVEYLDYKSLKINLFSLFNYNIKQNYIVFYKLLLFHFNLLNIIVNKNNGNN